MSGIDASALADGLRELLTRARLVTWLDQGREYTDQVDEVAALVPDAQLITVDHNEFATKLRVLRDQPKDAFILYRPGDLPPLDTDLLADIRCGYPAFSADASSMLARELDLDDDLTPILREYDGFFTRERIRRIKDRKIQINDKNKLLAVMSAVLLDIRDHSFSSIFVELANSDAREQAKIGKLKWGLADFFWEGTRSIWKYQGDPELSNLMTWLFIEQRRGWDPALASAQRDFATWMGGVKNQDAVKVWATRISEDLGLAEELPSLNTADLERDLVTPGVDDQLIRRAVTSLIDGRANAADVRTQRSRRASSLWKEESASAWEAAEAGGRFLHLIHTHRDAAFRTAGEGFALYTDAANGLWQVDQAYRHYVRASRATGDPDVFGELDAAVETIYLHDFLRPLSAQWDAAVRALPTWRIPAHASSNPGRQSDFYDLMVRNAKKTAVIVSDALRYEAGAELAERLIALGGATVEITPWYTLLPSVTALGMAALLPNRSLSTNVRADALEVRADGEPTGGLAARDAVLRAASGDRITAHTYQTIAGMTRDDLRALGKGMAAIYVYHDHIDAVGDHAASESRTPEAVEKALKDLAKLVTRLRSADFHRILITADHGFLYQARPLPDDTTAKQGTAPHAEKVLLKKRRYQLGDAMESSDDFAVFPAAGVGLASGPDVALPFGMRRSRVQGRGDQFVHGGASLQEISVPVIEVNTTAGLRARDVEVELSYSTSRISMTRITPKVIQKDPIAERIRPIEITVGIIDADTGKPLSNVERLTLDSVEATRLDRARTVELILLDGILQEYAGKTVLLAAHKVVNGMRASDAPVASLELEVRDTGFGGLGGFTI